MTAQVEDIFLYRNTEYSVAGISAGQVFDISRFSIEPAMASTCCYRGYQAVYGVLASHLVLSSLHVNLIREGGPNEEIQLLQGPVINGVAPSLIKEVHDLFNNHYENLNFPLEYSGGLLLADGFIHELYVHMGFHPAWKYRKVVELIFEAGVLKEEFDRSAKMAEIREMVADSQTDQDSSKRPGRNEIMQFIERAFDRTYTSWTI